MSTTSSDSSSSCFVSPSSNLRYDLSRKEAYQARFVDSDGLSTDLSRQPTSLHGMSAEEGVQLIQDCIMSAAHNTCEKAKSSTYQPKTSLSLMTNADLLSGNTKMLCRIHLAM